MSEWSFTDENEIWFEVGKLKRGESKNWLSMRKNENFRDFMRISIKVNEF